MRAMRALLLLVAALSACAPDAEPPAPPKVPIANPKPPIVNRIPPAPLEKLAFVREDGLWTVRVDGSELARIVPPTLPRAAEPSWSTDRRRLAFAAASDPDSNLYPRNLYYVRPEGADLRQVTPMPGADLASFDGPKGIVRGRAVAIGDQARRPLPNLRVGAYGLRKTDVTDADGNFQTFLPVGGGWIKLSGTVEGKPVLAWRFAASVEGRITDLKDVPVPPGLDDEPAAPAWCDQDRQLLYVMRHHPVDRVPGAPRSTLRRIRIDGSGDERVAAFTEASIIAGPVVRGDSAWIKMSDGAVLRVDLKTKIIAESTPAGLSAPDALAVSPDGGRIATLKMDATGSRTLLILLKGVAEPVAEFKAGESAPQSLDFSPDGTRIVMDRVGPDGKSGLWLLTLSTRKLDLLIENGTGPVWHGR
jgi:hypothetical protein